MRWVGVAIIVIMGLCSVALLMMDLRCGQDYVRGFFTDILPGADYPLPYQALFGINTTLAVCMLWGMCKSVSLSVVCPVRFAVISFIHVAGAPRERSVLATFMTLRTSCCEAMG